MLFFTYRIHSLHFNSCPSLRKREIPFFPTILCLGDICILQMKLNIQEGDGGFSKQQQYRPGGIYWAGWDLSQTNFCRKLASQSIGFLENIQKIFFPKIMDYNKFAPCIPNQLFISSTVPAEEGNPFDNTLRGTIGS